MANVVQITANYVSTGADLTGGVYTVGDSLYLTADTLEITNKSADGLPTLSGNGVVGVVVVAPDISVSGSRLVMRVDDDDLLVPLMRLLQARML